VKTAAPFGERISLRLHGYQCHGNQESIVGEWRRWNYGEVGRNSVEGRGIHHVESGMRLSGVGGDAVAKASMMDLEVVDDWGDTFK
jgi:hypothetical protein